MAKMKFPDFDHIEELLLLLDPLDRLVDDHGNDEDEHPKKEAEKG